MKTIYQNSNYKIDKNNKIIIIRKTIGVHDLYQEISKIFSQVDFMDSDIPFELTYTSNNIIKIFPINNWKIRNTGFIKDQEFKQICRFNNIK